MQAGPSSLLFDSLVPDRFSFKEHHILEDREAPWHDPRFVLRPITPQTILGSWKLSQLFYELVLSVRLLAELLSLHSRAEASVDNSRLISCPRACITAAKIDNPIRMLDPVRNSF